MLLITKEIRFSHLLVIMKSLKLFNMQHLHFLTYW